MKVVTTCHKAGFEQYGHRWVEGRKNWPKAEFVMYAEGFDGDKNVNELPELEAFKRRNQGYRSPDWRFDVVRFANKAFAAYDAFYHHKGIGVWLDADCVTYKKIPKGFIEKQLGDAYLACFQRQGVFTETGLWIANCDHPQHKQFMNAFREWYLSNAFKRFNTGWHDCIAFDNAIKATGVPVKNLSGEHVKSLHPMSQAEFGKYVDHCKGARKELGYSPENRFRKAA